MLRREVSREERTADTISLLLLCATQLTTKTPHFAALVGLLEKEQPEFVAQLLAKGREELDEALATGQRTRSRLLLRFFAALAAAGVVEGQSLVASLQVLVDRALQLADAGALLWGSAGRQGQGRAGVGMCLGCSAASKALCSYANAVRQTPCRRVGCTRHWQRMHVHGCCYTHRHKLLLLRCSCSRHQPPCCAPCASPSQPPCPPPLQAATPLVTRGSPTQTTWCIWH